MKRTTLRAAGVSALAAVVFGIAAPAASATTAAPARTVASVQTINFQQSAGSPALPTGAHAAPSVDGPSNGEAATAGMGSAAKAAWEAIKRAGLAKKAWEAAKKGQTGFVSWVNSLSNWNPAKWVIKGLPGFALQELIAYILNNYTG